MIYPTPRAVGVAALGAPLAAAASTINATWWLIGLYWCLALMVAIVIDALIGRPLATTRRIDKGFPAFAVARRETWRLTMDFSPYSAPKTVSASLSCDSRLGPVCQIVTGSSEGTQSDFEFDFSPVRRGLARMSNVLVRWRGPLGLVWKQKRVELTDDVAITSNIRQVTNDAVNFFSRHALFGAKVDRSIGEGREFHELREFHTGMDRRTVDWKQSARHGKLLAKQFQTERNHHVMFAIDSGRTMCEPVGTAPRVDRAIEASLLTAMACLRDGDLAGFFGFDSRPRLATGMLSGPAAFATLQQVSAEIDYSSEETNYVLALASLSGMLKRRSLIVVFTEFADQTAAQLLLEGMSRLLKRHLVIFVAFKDEELEALATTEPTSPHTIAQAVVAGSLLKERDLVLAKLRAMGAHIVEGPARQIGPHIISRYLDLKAKDLL